MKRTLPGMTRPWTALVGTWSVVVTLVVDAGGTTSVGVRLRAEPGAGTMLTKRYTESIDLQLTSRTYSTGEKNLPISSDMTDTERWTDERTVTFTDSYRVSDDDRLIERQFVELTGRADLSTPWPDTSLTVESETPDSALPWNSLELVLRGGGLELIGSHRRPGIDAVMLERRPVTRFMPP